MLSRNVLYYGKDEPLPDRIPLRAGPLSLIYEDGDIRYVKAGAHEIVRRIYVATRDANWGTVENRLSNVEIEAGDTTFAIRYAVENREGDIDFSWQGRITGTADGVIRFEMEGVAHSTFLRGRIGFCVLHPAACAGAPARIEHVDGSVDESPFPLEIAPQRIVDGTVMPVAPFQEMAALAYEVAPGLWARVAFSGDIFEMEDQRNWTDASFKSYCTPLRLPFPAEVTAGTQISQAITLSVEGAAGVEMSGGVDAVTVEIDDSRPVPLPLFGLGAASHGQPLTPGEATRLRALRLHHIRVDLYPGEGSARIALRHAAEQAAALGAALEVAVHFTEAYAAEAKTLGDAAGTLPSPLWAWLIFRHGATATPRAWIEAVAPVLREATPDALVGSGTDAFFTEFNRTPPPLELLDLGAYSLNPQVHAFDNGSLMETLAAQGETVRSARRLMGDKHLAVTPVTLRMRSNPNATGPEPPPAPDTLPPQVDYRQLSLLAAGWTLGSVKYLAESGADSVTYYETTGWRGVMERVAGSPLPERFPSLPGTVFPLYHVLADIGEYAGGEVLPVCTSDPLAVEGMAMRQDGRTRLLLANLGPSPQTVVIRGLAGIVSGPMTVRRLDEHSALHAMRTPEAFRKEGGEAIVVPTDELDVALLPYAIACLTTSKER